MGDIQQKDISACSPAVRAKYVNSKNVALEILRMFVLNFYEPLLDTSMKSNVRLQSTLPAASLILTIPATLVTRPEGGWVFGMIKLMAFTTSSPEK